jgi:hypothetical protein
VLQWVRFYISRDVNYKMKALTTASPIIAKTVHERTNFFFNCNPDQLDALQPCSTFTIVYAPVDDENWEAVDYRVIEPRKAYAVIKRRKISALEVYFFENLQRFNDLKQHYETFSNQMRDRRRLIVPTHEMDTPSEDQVA